MEGQRFFEPSKKTAELVWDGIPYQMHAYLLQGKVRKV